MKGTGCAAHPDCPSSLDALHRRDHLPASTMRLRVRLDRFHHEYTTAVIDSKHCILAATNQNRASSIVNFPPNQSGIMTLNLPTSVTNDGYFTCGGVAQQVSPQQMKGVTSYIESLHVLNHCLELQMSSSAVGVLLPGPSLQPHGADAQPPATDNAQLSCTEI